MSIVHMDDFYDIYGLWHTPWWQSNHFKIVVAILIIFLLLIFIVWFARKILKRGRKLSAWEVAQHDLALLAKPDMLNESTAKIFYSRLTSIIKQYLRSRYGFDVVGKTENELISFLDEQIIFPRDLVPVLCDVFDHASQNKFANKVGLIECMQNDLALIGRVVKDTVPKQLE